MTDAPTAARGGLAAGVPRAAEARGRPASVPASTADAPSTATAAPGAVPSESPAAGVLVIGYGNPLRGDDGAGPRAAELLAGDPRLRGARVLTRHQLTPELADEMRSASLVILVDARAGAEPGSVDVVRVEAGGDVVGAGASHHVDPGMLAGLARELWGAAPDVVAVSVGAASFETGEGLSQAVERVLPRVVEAVAALVEGRRRA